MPSLMTPVSDASLNNEKQFGLTSKLAKNNLGQLKQGTLTVGQYLEECHYQCNIINGEDIIEHTDITLLTAFKNGLNNKTRKTVKLAPTDPSTARKVANQQEMFSDLAKQQLLDLNKELTAARLEIKDLKEMVVILTESQKKVQKEQAEIANDQFQKLLVEIKKVGDANAVANAPKEKDEEKMAEMRNTLETIGKNVVMNYDWIVAIYRGLEEANKKPDDDGASENVPNGEAEMVETPIIIPTAVPPPLFPTKRSHSSDGEDEDEDGLPNSNHKRPRTMTATEEAVLEKMKKVLSESELETLNNENVTNGIEKLYNEYSLRIDEARRWMGTKRRVYKVCCLCGSRRHHARDCDKVRTIKERKRVMRREHNFCMECTNLHEGPCKGILRDCWLCAKATAAGRFLPSGAHHARMWCPLQEQFFKDKDITNKLFKAKKLLSEST